MSRSKFPWDHLKAETLRTMCQDLGAAPIVAQKKSEMESFMKMAEKQGLDATLREYTDRKNGGSSSTTTSPTRVSKRKQAERDAQVQEEQAVHRPPKRTRRSDPGPGPSTASPRRTSRVPIPTTRILAATMQEDVKPKRKPRLRRKSSSRSKRQSPVKPRSSNANGNRQIFDGVEILVRTRPTSAREEVKVKGKQDDVGDVGEGSGEPSGEANGDGEKNERNADETRGYSMDSGSNKENEGPSAVGQVLEQENATTNDGDTIENDTIPPVNEEHDLDAEGSVEPS